MKIAIWHNLPSGGGKRALYYHVKGLVERGHTVESWCPPTADRTYLSLSELIPEHIVPFREEAKKKLPLDRYLKDYRKTIAKLESMEYHCRVCAEQINAGGFDILSFPWDRSIRVKR